MLVLMLLAWTAPVRAEAEFTPTAATVVARVGTAAVARPGIHRARLDQPVTLYAAVQGRMGSRRVVVTAAPALELSGKRVPPGRIVRPEAVSGVSLRWFKVQPTGQWYDNTRGGFHWDPIAYRAFAEGEWGTAWSRPADAHPRGDYPDTHAGAGTMAFQVRVRAAGAEVASAGPQDTFRGGLADSVTRVAFRRDDTYLGRLTELFNTPYIWGSAGTRPEDHQAERLIGSDCADLIVYGARRLGKKLRYRATWHLPQVTRTIARAEKVDAAGRYLDRAGKPLAIGEDAIRIGDLLLFKGHVGALAEDREPVGVLDGNDVMLHTYWAPPDEQPLKETAYAQAKVRVLRFK